MEQKRDLSITSSGELSKETKNQDIFVNLDKESAKKILNIYEINIRKMTEFAEKNGKNYQRFHFYNFLNALKAIAEEKPFYTETPRFVEFYRDSYNPHPYLSKLFKQVNITDITTDEDLISIFNYLKNYKIIDGAEAATESQISFNCTKTPQPFQAPEKIHIFSYKEEEIFFSEYKGTEVTLNTCESFKTWFSDLPLNKAISIGGNHSIYKLNDNTLAINSGPKTPGIQIKKLGDVFIACNNLTADNNDSYRTSGELELARKNNLKTILTMLEQMLQKISKHHNEKNEPQKAEKESEKDLVVYRSFCKFN